MVRRAHPKAVNFFRRNADYSHRSEEGLYKRRKAESVADAKKRIATALARAEAEAVARGWRVEWEGDPDGGYGAVLRDLHGHVLASHWELPRMSREKCRVHEAEMFHEALGDER